MGIRTTVELAISAGPDAPPERKAVPGYEHAPGLVVTGLDDYWTITHRASGLRLPLVCARKSAAVAACLALGKLTDWTAPADEILAPGKLYREVREIQVQFGG